MEEIVTTYIHPPIPDRSCDWQATFKGYDGGDPIGHGRTKEEAIMDLMLQVEDDQPRESAHE